MEDANNTTYARVQLMIQNAHIARHDFVFQNSARWNIDPVAVIRNDDNGSLFKMSSD